MIEAPSLPTGTVTFFFSDIEGSTNLLQRLGEERYRSVVEEHHALIRAAIHARGGIDIATEGDSFFAVFASARDAAMAAADTQRSLGSHHWPFEAEVRVRMGLHTGEGHLGGDNYVGLDVNRGARIAAAGHGGQVLLSEATKVLVAGSLPDGLDVKDLGEHRLKDLMRPEHIYQLVIPHLSSDFPPIRSLDSRPNNLPVQLTSFVGRQKELEELRNLLRDARLVTLTGPGGTGKTRLSIQLVAEASDDFEDGVFFVSLSTVSEPEQVASAIAESLNLKEALGDARPPLTRVIDYLVDKTTLLVLDNFEQVLGAASLVTELLKATERAKIVVTSRAALRVYGEREFPVPPLVLPDPQRLPDLQLLSQYEAVALFVQRAVAVKPDFEIDNKNAPAVAEICARLDGLPLAIELAAARIRVLTPEALLARLGERLKLLVGGSRDLPARQQTLRRAIEWSYDLLDDSEKALFAALAAFMGSFGLDEAEKICEANEPGMDFLDGLTSLVDKSLLRAVDAATPEPRYYMLETLREFAVEKLNEREDVEALRRRHAELYTHLAEAAARELHTLGQRDWLDRLERDHDNLRAAHDWAVDRRERDIALRLSTALWRFWQMRGHLHEARRRVEEALALSRRDERTPLRAEALQAAGSIAYWQGDVEAQTAYYHEALALWRALDDKAGLAGALYDAGFAVEWPHLTPARPLFEESLALYREIGDRHGEAKVRWGLGLMYLADTNEFAAAQREFEEALEVFRDVGDVFMLLWSLYELGVLAVKTERPAEAKRRFREALRLGAEARDVSAILLQLDALATLAFQEGRLDRAVRLRAAVTAIKAASGAAIVDTANDFIGTEEIQRERLGEQRLHEVWTEGERLSLDDAIAYALEDES